VLREDGSGSGLENAHQVNAFDELLVLLSLVKVSDLAKLRKEDTTMSCDPTSISRILVMLRGYKGHS
jgi:hypothetical protein